MPLSRATRKKIAQTTLPFTTFPSTSSSSAKATPASRTTRKTAAQTTLQFSPLTSSSPTKDEYSQAVQDRLAHVRHSKISTVRRPPLSDWEDQEPEPPSDKPDAVFSSPLSDPLSSSLTDPPSSPNPQSAPATFHRNKSPLSTEDEHDEPLSSIKRKSIRLAKDADVLDLTPSRRSTRLKERQRTSLQEESSFEDENPGPKKNTSEIGSPETSGDDEDVMVTKPAPRRRVSKSAFNDAFVVDDDRIDYISSDDDVPKASAIKRKRSTKDDFEVADDEIEFMTTDDESAGPSKSPKKSHSHKSPRTPRRWNRRIQEELKDDLEDLRDNDSATKSSRTRGGPVTTQRDKTRAHLELLKRRRAGEKIPRVEDSDDEEDVSEEIDLNLIGHPANEHSEQESVHSSIDTEPEDFENQEVDDDFIETDSPGGRRLPHPDIPLEFTSYASSKPKDLFIHIIEWLVKNKIAPAFSRTDPLWKLSFDKVNDQVVAQAGSRLISAAWGAEFKHAVLARPNVKVVYMADGPDEDMPSCDACNRTNHPAQYDFVFSGQAYHKDTLEPIETDEDDEDDARTENASVDDKGHVLAPASQHFYLGRFCAANAEMGHKLTHWKYHLNENLLAYLEEQGALSAEAIVAREKLNKKRREKEAEAIVDQMQDTGMIKELWDNFKNDLDDARLGMEGHEKKGGRSQQRVGTVRGVRESGGVIREWREDKGGRQTQTVMLVESDSD